MKQYEEKVSDNPDESTIARALEMLANNEPLLAKYGGYGMNYIAEAVDPLLSLHNRWQSNF